MKHTSIMASLASAFQIPLRRAATPLTASTTEPAGTLLRIGSASTTRLTDMHKRRQTQQQTSFSTTAPMAKRRSREHVDRRVRLIRYALAHPTKYLPKPLSFTRLRALRHWTIHRAWQLHQRTQRTAHENELQRQWQSMREACEELRVGAGDGGRLFRQAMARKGYWGGRSTKGEETGLRPGFESGDSGRVEKGREAGVPIEYAKGLVDAPPRDGAWDHAWTRT